MNFLSKFVPLPNLGNNFVTPLPSPKEGTQYLTRIDHEIGQKSMLYGRYIYNNDYLFSPAGNLANWGIDQTFYRQGVVVSETHLFSPSRSTASSSHSIGLLLYRADTGFPVGRPRRQHPKR